MTQMETEALEAPYIIANQLVENIAVIEAIAKKFHENPPAFAVTIARGSSDHAASFAQYLFANELGLVTASLPPSLSSIYKTELKLKGALALAISQSGASPDICASLEAAKKAGAITVAMTNNPESRLANIAEFVLPLHAGEEKAVAATKTYLTSLSAIVQLVAYLKQDKKLLKALAVLPEALIKATQSNWDILFFGLMDAHSLIVIGRGTAYPIAQEAALKFKETCGIHAEPFSAAEFQHGPMALIKKDFPVLFFGQDDAALPGLLEAYEKITALGAKTFIAAAKAPHSLPLPQSLHPVLDPLLIIQAFYIFIARLSVKRGYNPDKPVNLKKITETH
jgi:glucosamine--fructose-6-phosphate aminotransferase (isomerizing)